MMPPLVFTPQTVLLAVVLLAVLVAIHELGHLITAKACGVRVNEFSLGFGPVLRHTYWAGTQISLRAVPLGGFVRMEGEDAAGAAASRLAPTPRDRPIPSGGTLISRPRWQRALVLAAGSLSNILLALILLSAYAATGPSQAVIQGVVSGSPAAAVGLRSGDVLAAIDGVSVDNSPDGLKLIRQHAGSWVRLSVLRNGHPLGGDLRVHLRPPGQVALGVRLDPRPGPHPLADVIWAGQTAWMFVGALGSILGQMIAGLIPLSQLSGPIGIVGEVGAVASAGWEPLLFWTALISLQLGLLNLLPLPALDGGRLLFLAVEAVRGRPLDPRREGLVHYFGFAMLISLMVVISFNDVLKVLHR
jgi:regulator of sigma E protease